MFKHMCDWCGGAVYGMSDSYVAWLKAVKKPVLCVECREVVNDRNDCFRPVGGYGREWTEEILSKKAELKERYSIHLDSLTTDQLEKIYEKITSAK